MGSPKSKFLKVKSPDSDYTVIIFDKCDTVVKDPVTGSTIAMPTGGKAKIWEKSWRNLSEPGCPRRRRIHYWKST